MSTATATRIEYGVRYRPLGDSELTVRRCEDAVAVGELIAELADEGVTVLVPVPRQVAAWRVAPEGLPAAVRALAELRYGEELDDETASSRLADLFGEGAAHAAKQWLELVDAVSRLDDVEQDRVDWPMVDLDLRTPELLDAHHEQLVIEAAAAVIAAAEGTR